VYNSIRTALTEMCFNIKEGELLQNSYAKLIATNYSNIVKVLMSWAYNKHDMINEYDILIGRTKGIISKFLISRRLCLKISHIY
jgi:hypothetical protein